MRPRLLDLLERSERVGDCLIWAGWKNSDGYGYVRHEGRDRPAHRVLYELCVGQIPDGYEIDHLCRNRACVRLEHLESVTHGENQRRLAGAQVSCRKAGHDWTDPHNVYTRRNGRRWCAECARVAAREKYARV